MAWSTIYEVVEYFYFDLSFEFVSAMCLRKLEMTGAHLKMK